MYNRALFIAQASKVFFITKLHHWFQCVHFAIYSFTKLKTNLNLVHKELIIHFTQHHDMFWQLIYVWVYENGVKELAPYNQEFLYRLHSWRYKN